MCISYLRNVQEFLVKTDQATDIVTPYIKLPIRMSYRLLFTDLSRIFKKAKRKQNASKKSENRKARRDKEKGSLSSSIVPPLNRRWHDSCTLRKVKYKLSMGRNDVSGAGIRVRGMIKRDVRVLIFSPHPWSRASLAVPINAHLHKNRKEYG